MPSNARIIILSGPTASGKSGMALEFAKQCGQPAVIINCDSKQLYQEIPIITAQPTASEQQSVPHALYGVLPASQLCSVSKWLELAKAAIDAALADNKLPIIVGGTGMYIKALLHGMSPVPETDPEIRAKARYRYQELGEEEFYFHLAQVDPLAASRLAVGDSQRVLRAYEVMLQTGISIVQWQEAAPMPLYPLSWFVHYFLNMPREQIYENCDKRFQTMIDQGAIEEVERLAALKLDPTLPAMKAHGVPELILYLKGELALDEAIRQAQRNTRHYVKRQFTWFAHQMPEAIPITSLQEMIVQASLGRLG